eukprot:360031-Chlamydomonas_euryale.AAC.2
MAENLASVPDLKAGQQVIMPVETPIKETGHIQILYGNLAPQGSVAKITGARGSGRCGEWGRVVAHSMVTSRRRAPLQRSQVRGALAGLRCKVAGARHGSCGSKCGVWMVASSAVAAHHGLSCKKMLRAGRGVSAGLGVGHPFVVAVREGKVGG